MANTDKGWAAAQIDDLKTSGEADEGGAAWKSIRHHFDIQAFGASAYVAPAGTLVYVGDPGLTRTAFAREAGTVVLAFGAAPGEAFSVSPWERRWTEGA
jgi:hypothetical protein